MSQEDNKFSDDLEQIVRHQESSLRLLENLQSLIPHLADDFGEMREAAAANINDLKAIAERVSKQAEEISSNFTTEDK